MKDFVILVSAELCLQRFSEVFITNEAISFRVALEDAFNQTSLRVVLFVSSLVELV